MNISMPRLDFRAENDTVLRRELTEAQKPIAVIDASLDALMNRLEQGEKDRAKIKEPRWQASYDLAQDKGLRMWYGRTADHFVVGHGLLAARLPADVLVHVNVGGTFASDMDIRLANTTLASMAVNDFIL
jgi:hypothetical protein